jgi:hypothetical protein
VKQFWSAVSCQLSVVSSKMFHVKHFSLGRSPN